MSGESMIFIRCLVGFLLCFIMTVCLTKRYIKYSKNGQIERDFTLENHRKKQGTPTSGGIVFVLVTIIGYSIVNINWFSSSKTQVLILVFMMFFVVGLLDDMLKKITKKYDGLSPLIRLLLEAAVGIWSIVIIGQYYGGVSGVELPIINLFIQLGILMIPLVLFIIIGSANSVNLTDGLDGLASGMILFSLMPFVIYFLKNGDVEIALFLVCLIGSLVGFLIYNIHPARVFMGDAGSLPLGAVLGIVTIISKNYLMLLISGALFIFETLSVIIQVVYFKLTHKRIFLMAPFHHHLEKRGWPEWKIVMTFWMISFCLSMIASIVGVIG